MKEITIDIKTIQDIEGNMEKLVSDILEKHGIYHSLAYGSILGTVRHNGPIPWDLDMDMYIRFKDLWKVLKILRNELPEPFTVDYYDINPQYRLIYPRVSLKNSSSDFVHVDLFTLFGFPETENEQIEFYEKVVKINKIYYHYKNQTYYVRKTNRAKWKYIIAYCFAKIIEIFYLPIPKKYLRKQLYKLFSKYSIDESSVVAATPNSTFKKEVIKKEYAFSSISHKYNDHLVKIPQDYDSYLKQFYGDYMTIPDQKLIDERMELTAVISEKDYNLIFNR